MKHSRMCHCPTVLSFHGILSAQANQSTPFVTFSTNPYCCVFPAHLNCHTIWCMLQWALLIWHFATTWFKRIVIMNNELPARMLDSSCCYGKQGIILDWAKVTSKSSLSICHICQPFLQPEQLTWLHMHGLSFTPKSWAKFLAFVSTLHAWPYLKRPQQSTTVHIFVPPVSGLPSSVEAQIRTKLPCVFQLQSSSLRVTDTALWQSGLHWPSHVSCMILIFVKYLNPLIWNLR